MGDFNAINRAMSNIHSNVVPILFLRKELLMDSKEIVCKLIDYESPLNFHVRQYNPEFEPFIDHVKLNLNSRRILTKNDLVINMYVFVQKSGSNSIHRGRIVEILPDVIEVHLVDNGDTAIKEQFNTLTLYEFIESDGNIPRQQVIQCELNNMWFPDNMDVDTASTLRQFFHRELLYKILIVENDLVFYKSVHLFEKDTNIDISDAIIRAGIGQRICAAIKTDELPYEVSVLKGQSFLAYIYQYLCKLFIQPEPNVVDELEKEIQEYVKENPNPESLDVRKLRNTYCLATVNYDLWYRAQVKHVNAESIIVNLFDTGYLTEVSHKQIRPISSDLMKKPQLSVYCSLENKDFIIEKNAKKVLYNVTAKSIDTNGMLRVAVKEHCATPLSSPIVRSIEKISFVHVDGDSTYLRRSQDESKVIKMSETLLALCDKLVKSKPVVPGDVAVFESGGINYRCLVKSKESEMAIVHCVDSGREELVEESKLQYLGHSKIALLPALVTIVPTFPMAFPMSQRCGEIEFLADMRAVDDETEETALTQYIQHESKEKSLAEEKKNDLFVPDVTITRFTNFRDFETKSETISSLYEERINSELNLYKTQEFRCDKIIHNIFKWMGQIVVSFSSNTGRICRGRVLLITKEWTSCYRLDLGELEVFHEFYEPTDFLRTCPPICMSCALYSPKLVDIAMETGYWFSYVDRLIKDILTVEGVKFGMVVKNESSGEDDKSEVTLLLDNVDISEMLTARIESNKNYLIYKKRVTKKINVDLFVPDVETVTVVNFQTFREFETKSETLSSLYADRIDAELKLYSEGKIENDKYIQNFNDWRGLIMVGMSHKTGEFRRVIVSAVSSWVIMCYQLDHGDHEEFNEFYEPTEFLRTCPPIWRSCALYAPSFVGKELQNWFPNIDFLFKDIVSIEGVKFDMIVKKKGQEEDYVTSEVILLLDNIDISEMLCPISVRKKVDP